MEKKYLKPALWGLILLIVGAAIFFAAWRQLDYGSVTVPEGEFVHRSKTVSESFNSISIDEAACNVELLPAPDGVCRVEYSDSRYAVHKVYVKNNCLIIEEQQRGRKGFMFGISVMGDSGNYSTKLYLPQGEYNSLTVNTASGNISAEQGFSFRRAELDSASGSISLGGVVSEALSAGTASGSILLSGLELQELKAGSLSGQLLIENTNVAGEIDAGTASGEVKLGNIRCRSLEAEAASGEIELENVICTDEMSLETASGNISFERCDARELEFDTASGSVKGSLLSGKNFRVDTASGSVSVPEDSEGGSCSVETASGDVKITVAK